MAGYVPNSQSTELETPDDLFAALHAEFGFTIDLCASDLNHKLPRYYTKTQNALTHSWQPERGWQNPPYGKAQGDFIRKAYEECLLGAFVVCLPKAVTGAPWWHNFVMLAPEIRLIRGRLHFKGASHQAPFDNAIVIFDPARIGQPTRWVSCDRRGQPNTSHGPLFAGLSAA